MVCVIIVAVNLHRKAFAGCQPRKQTSDPVYSGSRKGFVADGSGCDQRPISSSAKNNVSPKHIIVAMVSPVIHSVTAHRIAKLRLLLCCCLIRFFLFTTSSEVVI